MDAAQSKTRSNMFLTSMALRPSPRKEPVAGRTRLSGSRAVGGSSPRASMQGPLGPNGCPPDCHPHAARPQPVWLPGGAPLATGAEPNDPPRVEHAQLLAGRRPLVPAGAQPSLPASEPCWPVACQRALPPRG